MAGNLLCDTYVIGHCQIKATSKNWWAREIFVEDTKAPQKEPHWYTESLQWKGLVKRVKLTGEEEYERFENDCLGVGEL